MSKVATESTDSIAEIDARYDRIDAANARKLAASKARLAQSLGRLAKNSSSATTKASSATFGSVQRFKTRQDLIDAAMTEQAEFWRQRHRRETIEQRVAARKWKAEHPQQVQGMGTRPLTAKERLYAEQWKKDHPMQRG